ncbi:MAG: hypothetical protein ACYC56_01040 [Candidatus Aquicultor sp.]
MARLASLKEVLGRIGFPALKRSDCWGVIKVEKMLQNLGLSNYEIVNQARVVRVATEDELMKIMLHLVPFEVSGDYRLTLGKVNDKAMLRFGCWQFEAGVESEA